MIRMPFPADVNPQPEAKFYRQSSEAFRCNASEAVTVHSFPKKTRHGRWLTVALLCIFALALAGCSAEESPALTSRDKGAALACEGMTAVWISETEHECFKEKS